MIALVSEKRVQARRAEKVGVLRKKRPSSSDWTAVGRFVEASLKKLGVCQAVRKVTLEDEVRAWVGETGAKYLAHVSCKAHVLTLEMTHPAWLQETSSRKDELLKTVQDRFPDLRIRDAKVALAKGGMSHRR